MFRLPARYFGQSLLVTGGMGLAVLAGCANATRPPDVPGAASFETGGRDRLVYTASASGTLYISDQDSNSILYSGAIHAGDHVVVDPSSSHVTIDDQVVVSTNVNHDDHRIYLLPGGVPPLPAAVSSASLTAARPMEVPATAHLGAEGRDRLEFTASDDGVIWVTDATHNSVVYRARVLRADRVVVDQAKNNLMVNGTRAYNGALPADDYCIFFNPGPMSAVSSTVMPPESPVIVGTRIPPVPTAAVVLSESGTLGTVTATQTGNVWVTDTAANRVVFSGHMLQGDTLIVDPSTGRITLNGNRVQGTAPGRYRVSFMSGS